MGIEVVVFKGCHVFRLLVECDQFYHLFAAHLFSSFAQSCYVMIFPRINFRHCQFFDAALLETGGCACFLAAIFWSTAISFMRLSNHCFLMIACVTDPRAISTRRYDASTWQPIPSSSASR